MKKEELEKLIKLGYSQRKISDELKSSQSNVKYWLKKFYLKTNNNTHNKKEYSDGKLCVKCNKVKPIEEFYRKYPTTNNNLVASYCKKCSNNYHTERVKIVKLKMIEYKGGKCVHCDLSLENAHYSVFDFHHLNPEEKDINFRHIKYQKWEKIKKELDKCILLCSNCHRIEHAKLEGW